MSRESASVPSVGSLRPADLPVPPQAALALMRACADPQADSRALAKLAASDPVLTAELLRVANSPFFGLGTDIGSIARAVTVLGRRALRNLVLSISVRDALRAAALPGLDIGVFWEDLLRCAVAARVLGAHCGVDPEDCFTAGLLADFGLLVLFRTVPDKAHLWTEWRLLDPELRYSRECEELGASHDQVALLLARSWSLPEPLAAALGGHHHCESVAATGAPDLCRVLQAADWMAAVYGASHKARVLDGCRSLLLQHFGLDAQRADDCLAAMPQQIEEAASGLGLGVSEQPDFDAVLRHANARLAEENLSYQELTWRLSNAIKERDRLAAELNRELELAGEIQRSLLPASQPPSFPLVGLNLPAKELSGDFFDYFTLADGRIYFNLADVSGKGITAALLMAKTSSLFRCLGKKVDEPAALLAHINRELCDTSTHGMFVSMVAGLYDPATGGVQIINAGHPPVLLLRPDATTVEIGAHAPPLGVMPEVRFTDTRVNLADASLYAFSDGLLEARLGDGEMVGVDGVERLLRALADKPPAERLAAVAERMRAAELRDDLTILLLEQPDGAA